MYLDNPHGRAAVFLAVDELTGEIVGSGAVLPRRMWVAGAVQTACIMADFWIHPDYRSLGPAVKLQRACIEHAAAAGFAFYDLPQGNMAAVYRRMGLLGADRLPRFAKPVRTGPFLERRLHSRLLARPVALLGDLLLRASDWRCARQSRLRSEVHAGDFGRDFDRLTQASSATPGIRAVRDAEYLQWRFRRHYHLRHTVITARDGENLAGYAVTVRADDYVDVVDLFPPSDPEAAGALLAAVVRKARQDGAVGIAVSALGAEGPLTTAFLKFGLRERDSRPFIVHLFPAAHASRPDAGAWYLTYGDIDY